MGWMGRIGLGWPILHMGWIGHPQSHGGVAPSMALGVDRPPQAFYFLFFIFYFLFFIFCGVLGWSIHPMGWIGYPKFVFLIKKIKKKKLKFIIFY
jgi:hypothetical protein